MGASTSCWGDRFDESKIKMENPTFQFSAHPKIKTKDGEVSSYSGDSRSQYESRQKSKKSSKHKHSVDHSKGNSDGSKTTKAAAIKTKLQRKQTVRVIKITKSKSECLAVHPSDVVVKKDSLNEFMLHEMLWIKSDETMDFNQILVKQVEDKERFVQNALYQSPKGEVHKAKNSK